MSAKVINKTFLVKRLDEKAKALKAVGFEDMSLLITKASKVIKEGISDNKTTRKFTAIYSEHVTTGFGLDYTETLMKRIEKQENETLEQMLEREEVAEGLVFLFHGHSQMQGE